MSSKKYNGESVVKALRNQNLANTELENIISDCVRKNMIHGECVVCLDKSATHGFIECQHMVICNDCIGDLNKDNIKDPFESKCPKCRVKVEPSFFC